MPTSSIILMASLLYLLIKSGRSFSSQRLLGRTSCLNRRIGFRTGLVSPEKSRIILHRTKYGAAAADKDSGQAELESFETDLLEQESKTVSIANTASLAISVLNPFGPPCVDANHALKQIFALLEDGTDNGNGKPDYPRLEYLVKYLESTYVPIHTPQFFNMVHEGSWRFVFSNVLTPGADASLRAKVYQIINPDESTLTQGKLVNRMEWTLTQPTGEANGTLDVKSSYRMNNMGALEVELIEHLLVPRTVPDNYENLIMSIQRTVPFQFFDPDHTMMRTTYVDPEIRITRVSGEKYPNVINVYIRDECSVKDEESVEMISKA